MGNVIVGQSGGPTAVINASLAGVYKTAKDRGANKVYGMQNGIKGFIEGRYVDLSHHIRDNLDIELLRRTPSSFLGSCRYKLPSHHDNEEIFAQIFDKLKELEIECFLYIGGNDSMDSVMKLSRYAQDTGSNIRFVGVPKTIDNDLAITDHTPGFGSAAKYIGSVFKEIIRDGSVYGNGQINIVEIMGRNAGWLTAAASLARCEDCEGPDMIFLPETPFSIEGLYEKINSLYERNSKAIVIAVSEGIQLADGTYVCEYDSQSAKSTDAFGHKSLGGTASVLSGLVSEKFKRKTRSIELSILQRAAAHMQSRTDNAEAFLAGGQAVKAALSGMTGMTVVFERTSDDPYMIETALVEVEKIANVEKKVPDLWITENGSYVSKELTDYMRPLIQGELSQVMVDGLPRHLILNPQTLG
ncbi:MAG: 6-phosphofructokinase [Defluviitaleaceae bacterium]|nr:6-phosphofructokinase [Defluviitaleaceae bacterium]